MPVISVVIPVYRAEGCLRELHRRLVCSLEPISTDFEIILVEDCGGDRSWEVIQDLSRLDPRVMGLQFSRNFGQHYGITAGIDYSCGDWVVVMDCDLQDQPEEIPRLYRKALEGHEVVLARRGRRKDSMAKRMTSWLFYRLFRYLSGMNYDGEVGNFRIVSRNVIDNFKVMREQTRFFGGLMEWLGFPAVSVAVEHAERYQGESTYNYRKLVKLATEAIIAYSHKPLRLAIQIGFLMSALSFLYGVYIVLVVLFIGTPVMGWGSIIASIYFTAGIIIGILGIIGVYLGKTFDEAKKRPLYVVRRKTVNVGK
jgi:glycosyltransferase involved in cell wall biosynthesis